MWKARARLRRWPVYSSMSTGAFLHFERGARSGAYRAGAGCAAAQATQEGSGLAWSLIRSIDERTCRAVRPLIVNSAMVRAQMMEHYRVDAARIRLVRNGVDTSRFRPWAKADAPTLVFVGDNSPTKGTEDCLQVLDVPKEAHLEVVGDVGRRGRVGPRSSE